MSDHIIEEMSSEEYIKRHEDINPFKLLGEAFSSFIQDETVNTHYDFQLPTLKVKGGFLVITSTPTSKLFNQRG